MQVKNLYAISLIVAISLTATIAPCGQTVSAKLESNGVHIFVDDDLFTVYRASDLEKYPYFWPVNGPASGLSVTAQSAEPYPHHHSLFFGCDRVNDGNYWQEGIERGQIVSLETRIVVSRGPLVVFTNTCEWRRPDALSPFRDERRITVAAPAADKRLIDFEIMLKALTDVHIEKTNHSLFSARMMPELSVLQNATLVNAEGETGEQGTFGKKSGWCDYSGSRFGVREGLAILDHPSNPWFPCQWFTRDYGFFSPTPMNWLGDDGMRMKAGERLVLRYRVVVHSGDVQEAGIGELFDEWAREAR